jgi:hypothetical protein
MEYELKKIDLKNDDILVIRFDIDEIEGIEELNSIAKKFDEFLPNNRIICIPSYLDLTSISTEKINNQEDFDWITW